MDGKTEILKKYEILKENELAYKKRYGISLREQWKNKIDLGEINETYIEYYKDFWKTIPKEFDKEFVSDNLLIVLCGIGENTFLNSLIQRNSDFGKFVVYEPDFTSFLYLCCCKDISRLISDNRITLLFYNEDNPEDYYEFIKNSVTVENYEHIDRMILPGYEEKYQETADILWQLLDEIIDNVKVDVSTYIYFGEDTCKNELFAFSRLVKNYLISDFFKIIPTRSIPVILVGAGPSLNKNAFALKQAKGKCIMVAATHAAKTLEKNDIVPDFYAEIDPRSGWGFLGDKSKGVYRLLISAKAALDTQKGNVGNCFYFGFENSFIFFNKLIEQPPVENGGGSVMTNLFELFADQGFSTIIMVGQDLAFDSTGCTHSDGEVQLSVKNDEKYEVLGWNGDIVNTRKDWLMFLQYYKAKISKMKNVTVIDATEGGAQIEGCINLKLEDTIKQYCERDFSVEEWILNVPSALENGEYVKIKQEMISIRDAVNLVQRKLDKALKINKDLQVLLKKNSIIDSDFTHLAGVYDQLYHEILDGLYMEWLIYYCEGELQQYVQNKMMFEQAGKELEKLKLEAELFMLLQKKAPELSEYIDGLLC